MSRLTLGARSVASRCLRPLVRRAARSYIAGEHLTDALALRGRLAARGLSATLGYWDSSAESAQAVADVYLAALKELSGSDDYLSIKLPALRFSHPRTIEVAAAAKAQGVRLHCDSHDIETTGEMQSLVDAILRQGTTVSYTLPGRWRRSLDDADWAAERGLTVRVVKGQWPDPADPNRDLRTGFLEVIERLTGTRSHVAVASHDVPLAAEAIRRLQATSTSCSLELLYGLPLGESLKLVESLGVAVRVYVPYGAAYLPYALGKLKHNPRMAWWLLRDLLGAN
jgi:proline dehydrogenase